MAEFCHILGGPSQQPLEPETKEKKQRHNPNKAMFNCNSLSGLVKHYEGKENFSILSLSHLSPHCKIANNVAASARPADNTQNVPEIDQQSLSLSNDFICEN